MGDDIPAELQLGAHRELEKRAEELATVIHDTQLKAVGVDPVAIAKFCEGVGPLGVSALDTSLVHRPEGIAPWQSDITRSYHWYFQVSSPKICAAAEAGAAGPY